MKYLGRSEQMVGKNLDNNQKIWQILMFVPSQSTLINKKGVKVSFKSIFSKRGVVQNQFLVSG